MGRVAGPPLRAEPAPQSTSPRPDPRSGHVWVFWGVVPWYKTTGSLNPGAARWHLARPALCTRHVCLVPEHSPHPKIKPWAREQSLVTGLLLWAPAATNLPVSALTHPTQATEWAVQHVTFDLLAFEPASVRQIDPSPHGYVSCPSQKSLTRPQMYCLEGSWFVVLLSRELLCVYFENP